jgi:uncharacterized protein YraI
MYQHTKERGSFLKLFTRWTFLGKEQTFYRDLLSSYVFLVCLSQNAVTKEGYIQKEIRFALDVAEEKPEGTIFIIPAKLEECEIPERLAKWQWVNLFEKSGYDKLDKSLKHKAAELGVSRVSPSVNITKTSLEEAEATISTGNTANTDGAAINVAHLLKANEANFPNETTTTSSWKNWGDHPLVVGIGVIATLIAIVIFVTGRESLFSLFSDIWPVATNIPGGNNTAFATNSVTLTPSSTESPTTVNLVNTPFSQSTSTPTASPTTEPTPVPIATATSPGVSISSDKLNLRTGPGTNYPIIGTYPKNTKLEAIGRTQDSRWLKVILPDNSSGWMSITGLYVNIEIEKLAIAEIPLLPTSIPTATVEVVEQPSPDDPQTMFDGNWIGQTAQNDFLEFTVQNRKIIYFRCSCSINRGKTFVLYLKTSNV